MPKNLSDIDRQPGYYWVIAYDNWFVAEWDGRCWWIPGNEVEVEDDYFKYIDEKRIVQDVNKSLK